MSFESTLFFLYRKWHSISLLYSIFHYFTYSSTSLTIWYLFPLAPKEPTITTKYEEKILVSSRSNVEIGGKVQILDGSGLDISCPTFGMPPPTVTWFLNDSQLSEDDGFFFKRNAYILSIPFAAQENEGEYRCVSSNGIGKNATASMNLTVYGESTTILWYSIW